VLKHNNGLCALSYLESKCVSLSRYCVLLESERIVLVRFRVRVILIKYRVILCLAIVRVCVGDIPSHVDKITWCLNSLILSLALILDLRRFSAKRSRVQSSQSENI
jgi:hypothetical protein